MKKKLLSIALFSFAYLGISVAQTAEHPHSVGVAYVANDFQAPLTKSGWFNFNDNHNTSGVELSYTWYS